jgi:hypothetical protein
MVPLLHRRQLANALELAQRALRRRGLGADGRLQVLERALDFGATSGDVALAGERNAPLEADGRSRG